jgi:hypothetical protein
MLLKLVITVMIVVDIFSKMVWKRVVFCHGRKERLMLGLVF